MQIAELSTFFGLASEKREEKNDFREANFGIFRKIAFLENYFFDVFFFQIQKTELVP